MLFRSWLYAHLARSAVRRGLYRRFVSDLAARVPRGGRLLDVGAGPGYLLGDLARARPDLRTWGLDCSPDMMRRARRQQAGCLPGASRWLVADACALPFAAGSFDQVVATFSFHIWPCPVAGLQELRRLLKPGGAAWVVELRREAAAHDLRAFARETGLPFPLVYLGYHLVRWQHAVPAPALADLLQQAAGARGRLRPVHHVFWRAELRGDENDA